MALVARGHATLRCAIVRRAETSGPPQEARHTCSGVCVPIIRSACPLLPSPLLTLSPFSPVPLPVPSLLPALSFSLALQCVPYSTAGKKEERAHRVHVIRTYRIVSFLRLFVSIVRSLVRLFGSPRNVHEEK